jgi:hypothetical protein
LSPLRLNARRVATRVAFRSPGDVALARVPSRPHPKNGLSSDQCIIRGKHFFIRGLLEVPVVDGDGPFAWGVWVSLSRENMARAAELWNDPSRVDEPPYFGWLCNSTPGYPETLDLKTNVHSREPGMRPYIELGPTDHPLAIEQRNGITVARVLELTGQLHQYGWAHTA